MKFKLVENLDELNEGNAYQGLESALGQSRKRYSTYSGQGKKNNSQYPFIHHINGNHGNDDATNILYVTRDLHNAIHSMTFKNLYSKVLNKAQALNIDKKVLTDILYYIATQDKKETINSRKFNNIDINTAENEFTDMIKFIRDMQKDYNKEVETVTNSLLPKYPNDYISKIDFDKLTSK